MRGCARLVLVILGALLWGLPACGGTQASSLPDESDDYGEPTGLGERPLPIGEPLDARADGTQWRWVEAHCTEGPLDLASQGFEQELRVQATDQGWLLIYDQTWSQGECTQTVVQRAESLPDTHEFRMVEEIRIGEPSTDECTGNLEQARRGEVRRNGQVLEVLVQRSFNWCNGFVARMVYVPAVAAPLSNAQIARHYAAHFNRRDAARVAGLFASAGSLVEPFQVTRTGAATRHDGRDAVQQWYAETFAGVEWLALRPTAILPGDGDNGVVLRWAYMDPRLEEPFEGQNFFTIAAGEIFESRIELTAPPPEFNAEESPAGGEDSEG